MSADIASQIALLKRDAERMKEDIKKIRTEKHDTTLPRFAGGQPRRLVLRTRRVMKGHFAKIYALQWCATSNQLVSASQDGKLLVWDAMTTNKVHGIMLRTLWVMTCAYAPSGNLVASGGLDNICSVYNIRQHTGPSVYEKRELCRHEGYLSCCRFIDDKRIVTSSGDMLCLLWDIESGQPIREFKDHTGDVMSVSLRPDDEHCFVSGAVDFTAKLWDVRPKKNLVRTFEGHRADINAVQFIKNGYAFGTASDDSTCRIFDIRAFDELAEYFDKNASNYPYTSIDFSESATFLFAGCDDQSIKVWHTEVDCNDMTPVSLQAHENRVSCIGINGEGNALASGSWDSTIRIWSGQA